MTATATYGWLYDYNTGDAIRPATETEEAASIESVESGKHGGTGAFELDGRAVFVA